MSVGYSLLPPARGQPGSPWRYKVRAYVQTGQEVSSRHLGREGAKGGVVVTWAPKELGCLLKSWRSVERWTPLPGRKVCEDLRSSSSGVLRKRHTYTAPSVESPGLAMAGSRRRVVWSDRGDEELLFLLCAWDFRASHIKGYRSGSHGILGQKKASTAQYGHENIRLQRLLDMLIISTLTKTDRAVTSGRTNCL